MDPVTGRPAMAGYGVPDDLDGVLPWSWARDRLTRCRNYWLVTATAAGRPHALPVWGVWREAPSGFAFSCAPSARKARNLVENPQACVAVDDTVECVSVEGRVRRLPPGAEHDAVVEAYLDKYFPPPEREPTRAFLAANLLWVLDPERAFGIVEREEEFARRATRWQW